MIDKKNLRYWKKIFFFLVVGIFFGIFLTGEVFAEIQWSNPDSTEFNAGGSSVCKIENENSKWVENGQEINALNNCFKSDGVTSGGVPQTTCCPAGYQCNSANNNCEPSLVIGSCSDYVSESECLNFNPESVKESIFEEGKKSVGSDIENFCDTPLEYEKQNQCLVISGPCECKWNNVENKCESFFLMAECTNFDPIRTVCKSETIPTENKCSSGAEYYEIAWKGVVYDEAGNIIDENTGFCQGGTRKVSCVSGSEKVPFFGFWSFVLSLVLIAGVYFLGRKKI